MSKVRAKFVCVGIQDHPEYEQKLVSFVAVTSGSEENKSFAKLTPSANLNISISYDTEAVNAFEQGKEYFVDFSPTE